MCCRYHNSLMARDKDLSFAVTVISHLTSDDMARPVCFSLLHIESLASENSNRLWTTPGLTRAQSRSRDICYLVFVLPQTPLSTNVLLKGLQIKDWIRHWLQWVLSVLLNHISLSHYTTWCNFKVAHNLCIYNHTLIPLRSRNRSGLCKQLCLKCAGQDRAPEQCQCDSYSIAQSLP